MTTGRASSRQRGGGPASGPPANDQPSTGSEPAPGLTRGQTWIEHLDPSQITVPQGYFESDYDADRLAQLEASMASSVGQDSAATVKLAEDGTYYLTGGKHRLAAALNLGRPLRCEVSRGTLDDALTANAANAGNQSQPSQYGYMMTIGHRHQHLGHPPDRLAADLSKSPDWVEERLKVYYDTDPAVQEYLRGGLIRWGHAVLLAQLEDFDEQRNLLPLVLHMTVEELRHHIQEQGPPEPEEDDPEPGTHEVSFTASDQPRERQAAACAGCGASEDVAELQSARYCQECTRRFRDVVEGAPEGHSIVPNDLIQEAISWLGHNEISAKIGQRLERFLEGARDDPSAH